MPLPDKDEGNKFAKAHDLAYDALRHWIFNGPLKPGELIRDVEVAKLLGISRTPVREAIIRLAHEGLIDTSKGRKTRVTIPDLQRAPDLYRVGSVLDGLAVELAMPKIADADVRRMHALNAEMDKEVDADRLVRLDLEFHAVFRRLAGEVLQELLNGIETEIARLERLAFDDAEIRALTRRDHHAIADAVAAGNAAAAAEEVRRNWVSAWERLEARLNADRKTALEA